MGRTRTPTIAFEHVEIHEGEHYFVSDIDTDIDTASPKYWRITTPNTSTVIHLTFRVSVKAAAVVQFYENPTVNAAGTGITIYNNNRNSGNTTAATFFKDTTNTGEGTLLFSDRLVSGTNGRGGGLTARSNEIILEANQDYHFKITSDANDNQATIVLNFYEKALTSIY